MLLSVEKFRETQDPTELPFTVGINWTELLFNHCTGHVYWWVDYSQGIRLVYRYIKVNHKWMDYTDVLKNPVLKKLICDEEYCDFYKYPY